MKKIFILLMHTNSIPANFVKLCTKYQYSHVAISLTEDCNIIYSFGRRNVNNILSGGFCVHKKCGKFFKKFNHTNCKIYEIEVTDKQYENINQRLYQMEQNKEKYKYDFLGCGLRWLKIPITFKDRYVCSYFIANILENEKVHKFEKNTSFILPRDFENIFSNSQIYEGSYLEY